MMGPVESESESPLMLEAPALVKAFGVELAPDWEPPSPPGGDGVGGGGGGDGEGGGGGDGNGGEGHAPKTRQRQLKP